MKQLFRSAVVGWTVLGLVVSLVAIQAVPVNRLNPPVEVDVPAPANVRAVLRRACYDCHSNQTVWPWYSHVAPVSWLVARDVRDGRADLNFSTWNRLSTPQQSKKLRETWKEIAEGEMPPSLYLGIHRQAALSTEDRTSLRDWALHAASELEGMARRE